MLDEDDAKIVVSLPGPPRGKPRHRYTIRYPKGGGKPFVQEYPEPEGAKYERQLKLAAMDTMIAMGLHPLEGQVVVDIIAFCPIPESMTQWRKKLARAGVLKPTGGADDWDNIAKITDAFKGVVWRDDAQVVDGRVRKLYSDEPELVVTVTEEPPIPDTADEYRAMVEPQLKFLEAAE